MVRLIERTEGFFPEKKFKRGQLLEYRPQGIIIRGRFNRYEVDGDKLIAVIRTAEGHEYGDDQEKFTETPDA
jgi:hypothetical protein